MTAVRASLLAGLGLLVAAALVFLQPSRVPTLSAETLRGQSVSTTALLGRPYLVNFWATSCVTCVREMPALQTLHARFSARGFETVSVAMAYDPREFVDRFVQERGLPFQVLHDATGSWAQAFGGVTVTPTTFLINAKGEVEKRFVGVPDFDYLERWLDAALPKKT